MLNTKKLLDAEEINLLMLLMKKQKLFVLPIIQFLAYIKNFSSFAERKISLIKMQRSIKQ